jgi:hypothetical protein
MTNDRHEPRQQSAAPIALTELQVSDPDLLLALIARRAVGTVVVADGERFETAVLAWRLDHRGNCRPLLRSQISCCHPLCSVVNWAARPLETVVVFDVTNALSTEAGRKAGERDSYPHGPDLIVHVHGSLRIPSSEESTSTAPSKPEPHRCRTAGIEVRPVRFEGRVSWVTT